MNVGFCVLETVNKALKHMHYYLWMQSRARSVLHQLVLGLLVLGLLTTTPPDSFTFTSQTEQL